MVIFMAKKRKTKTRKAAPAKHGHAFYKEAHDPHAHLPGYLLIAFGLMALPINFGLIDELEFAKAWPLLLVIFGFVLLAKVQLCKLKSR